MNARVMEGRAQDLVLDIVERDLTAADHDLHLLPRAAEKETVLDRARRIFGDDVAHGDGIIEIGPGGEGGLVVA